jgi:hypothetical protein
VPLVRALLAVGAAGVAAVSCGLADLDTLSAPEYYGGGAIRFITGSAVSPSPLARIQKGQMLLLKRPPIHMNSNSILLLGLKQSVTAISKRDGQTLWKTELPTTLSGDDFVTLLSDEDFVFAHTEGKLHCLDLANGQILWSNDLKGYGYGIASLCFPGGHSAPDAAAAQTKVLQRRQQSAASTAH